MQWMQAECIENTELQVINKEELIQKIGLGLMQDVFVAAEAREKRRVRIMAYIHSKK